MLLGACMSRTPRHDRSGEKSYNSRELPPAQGLFTGPDGVWTVGGGGSRTADPDAARDVPKPARPPETLLCEPGYECKAGESRH